MQFLDLHHSASPHTSRAIAASSAMEINPSSLMPLGAMEFGTDFVPVIGAEARKAVANRR